MTAQNDQKQQKSFAIANSILEAVKKEWEGQANFEDYIEASYKVIETMANEVLKFYPKDYPKLIQLLKSYNAQLIEHVTRKELV